MSLHDTTILKRALCAEKAKKIGCLAQKGLIAALTGITLLAIFCLALPGIVLLLVSFAIWAVGEKLVSCSG